MSPQSAPLTLAAGVTWLAVATEPLTTLWHRELTPQALIGLAGLFGVLLLFVARERSRTRFAQRVCTVLQWPMALLAFHGFSDGLQPILLILVAAQAAMLFPPRLLVPVMAAANAVLLALMLQVWPLLQALVTGVAYLGFQGFAALTIRALAAAQAARDDARRINAELSATRALLAEGARAEERLHLSRELHDVAGHKLTALKLQLALCAADHAPLAAALAPCRQLADELLGEVRGVVGALRAHDGVDLHRALAALADGIPQPRIELVLADEARPADFQRAQALLRAAQEGVTNALRHAAARRLRVTLAAEADTLSLTVEDDGRGPAGSPAGMGLAGLQERLAAVGGSLHFAAAEPRGSRLVASVPR